MRIIYIDIESQRPDHLGCYGYHRNTTPCIDALACEGVRFDKVYAADAPCLLSRIGFYSGRFGIQTGGVGHGGTAGQVPAVFGWDQAIGQTTQVASSNSQYNFAKATAGFQLPMRIGGLFQRKHPADHRFDLSALHEIGKCIESAATAL